MNHLKHLSASAAAMLMLAGCVSTTPQFDRQFGSSVRAAVATQVIDPAAVRNANPVTGLDGAAANAAHAQYVKSYAAPAGTGPGLIDGAAK